MLGRLGRQGTDYPRKRIDANSRIADGVDAGVSSFTREENTSDAYD
jgi:hypothetical protein